MAVITISRELGSEGDNIVEVLCQALGYKRVDKAILSQIAEEAGVDVEAVLAKERSVTSGPKLVSGEMTSLYRKQPTAFEKKSALDDETYARILREAMERFAKEGNVIIVGRGGQMILRDWPTALHIRLYAPPEARVQRLMQRDNISESEAKRRVTRSDEQKRQSIRLMHNNADWTNLKYYHLAIDTARIPPEVTAKVIVSAVENLT